MCIDRHAPATARAERGQAIVEFCAGLIAVVVLASAAVSFGIAWQRKTETLLAARRQAAYFAWLGVNSTSGAFRRGWAVGPDQRAYTPDDDPLPGDWHDVLDPMLAPLREPVDLLRMRGNPYDFAESNAFADLENWGPPAGITFGFSRGTASTTIELDPALARLVTGQRSWEIESSVILPSFVIEP